MLLKECVLSSLWHYKEINSWSLSCSPQKNVSHIYIWQVIQPFLLFVHSKGQYPDGATSHLQLSDSKFNWSELCCLNCIMIMLLFALCLLTSEFLNWINADHYNPPQKNHSLTSNAHPNSLALVSNVGKISNFTWEKRRVFNEVVQR